MYKTKSCGGLFSNENHGKYKNETLHTENDYEVSRN